jgi:protoporphyrinogen oxidase
MTHVKYLILGAGPSGLSFAHTLLSHGERSFLVLEKEGEPGGLCRSAMVDGAPLDIGGGHFLDVRSKDVLELLFRFMPESEWRRYCRIANIRLRGVEVDHPLEGNLWQLPVEAQLDFLEAAAQAGAVRGEARPTLFEDWVRWKLGVRIADEYMLPYNRKLWRMDLSRLGTYWLHKLPDVSFRDTLLACLTRSSRGSLPAHGEFFYPTKHGYGEVWRRMGEALGDRLLTHTPFSRADIPALTVNGSIKAGKIINTIPWATWEQTAHLPADVADAVSRLAWVSVDIDYKSETLQTDAHWIYEPDEKIAYHRILCRPNFCAGARGHWTETNSRFSPPPGGFRHRNEFAYPVNTVDMPAALEVVHAWATSASILPLGRWGQWDHMNSDVAVSLAIQAAEQMLHDSR